jgi:hypothetical protein
MPTGIPLWPDPPFLTGQSTTGRGEGIAAVATSDPTLYGSSIVRTGVIHPGEKTRP